MSQVFTEVIHALLTEAYEGSSQVWFSDRNTGLFLILQNVTAEVASSKAVAEAERAEGEKQRAEEETLRAESEKQRAEDEATRAESEKQRAESETIKADKTKDFIVQLFAFCQTDFKFHPAARVVQINRYQRITGALNAANEPADFFGMQQQLACARRVGINVR